MGVRNPGIASGPSSRLEDHELAPRPLTIFKRTASTISHSGRAISISFKDLKLHHNLVSARRSSQSGSTAQLSPGQNPVRPSISLGHAALNVRKQRRKAQEFDRSSATAMSERSSVNLVTRMGVTNGSDMARSSLLSDESSPPAESGKGTWRLMPAVSRSYSAGPLGTARLSNVTNKYVHHRSSPAQRHQRAVTAGDQPTSYDHQDRTNAAPLRRRPSLRSRMISRVMGGPMNKSQVLHDERIDEDRSTITPPAGKGNESKPAASNLGCSSSSGIRHCTGIDLSHRLAAFPLPPRGSLPPPMSAEVDLDSVETRLIHVKKLYRPQTPSVLIAELTLTTEFDNIRFESGESMFVAIDVKATVPRATPQAQDQESRAALDVVVVIDNSKFTSAASLMASCETTRSLATLLDIERDRMAIVCTSTLKKEGAKSRVIAPLNSIKLSQLKRLLDNIPAPSPASDSLDTQDVLEIAQSILLNQSVEETSDRNDVPSYCHVVLLTSHMAILNSHLILDDKLTLHTVCASVLPQKMEYWPRTNGWKLRSSTGKEPQALSRRQQRDKYDDLIQDLKSLVDHARSGQMLGALTDVGVGFKEGVDFLVEEVHGKKKFGSMQPGEVHSIVVKLRCKVPKVAEAWLSGTVPDRDNNDLYRELERMLLGFKATPVLHAAVSYNQPLLPAETACCVRKTCNVRRLITAPSDPDNIRKPASVLESEARILVHQRLAYHCFTQMDSQAAMSALQKVIGEGDGRMACPVYITLLMKEQQFQQRVKQRCALFDSPRRDAKSPRQAHQPPGELLTSVHDSQVDGSRSTAMPATSVGSSTRRPTSDPDAARKLWGMLRAEFVGDEANWRAGRYCAISETEDERARNLPETALRNKRSIDTDTLRSLSFSVNERGGQSSP